MRGQPIRGTGVQPGLLCSGQQGKSLAQHVAREGVQAQPFAALGADQHRRIAGHARQALGCVVRRHQRTAQVGMQVVEDGDAGEEGDVGRIQVGQQQRDEVLAQHMALCRRRRRGDTHVAGAADGRQRELQAQGPAFGQLVQARGVVVVDAVAEVLVHDFERLFEAKAQHRLRHHRALPVGDEVVDAQVTVGARGHHHAQVGRCIAQHVGQRVDRFARQRSASSTNSTMLRAVCATSASQTVNASRPAAGSRVEQRVAEARACGRRAHRQRERAHQPLRAVLRLRQHPGDDGAVRQMFAPPLRQQRGLAEAGRGLHEDERAIAQAVAAGHQARTDHQVALQARRRDLEQQVVGRRADGRTVRFHALV